MQFRSLSSLRFKKLICHFLFIGLISSCLFANGGIVATDGCTDVLACNYDPNATVDDGSCIDPPVFSYSINEFCLPEIYLSSGPETTSYTWTNLTNGDSGTANSFSSGNGNAIIDLYNALHGVNEYVVTAYAGACEGETKTFSFYHDPYQHVPQIFNIEQVGECPGCEEIVLIPDYDGDAAFFEWFITDDPYNIIASSEILDYDPAYGTSISLRVFDYCYLHEDHFDYQVTTGAQCCNSNVLGCTVAGSCNYDPNATVDDNSCITPPTFSSPNSDPCNGIIFLRSTSVTTSYSWTNLTTGHSGTVNSNASGDVDIFLNNPVAGTNQIEITAYSGACEGETETYTYYFDGALGNPPTILNVEQVGDCPSCEDIVLIPETTGDAVFFYWYITGNPYNYIGDYSEELIYDPAYGTSLSLRVEDFCGFNIDIFNYQVTSGPSCCNNNVMGCTDADACNYDPNATVDDGSCIDPPGSPGFGLTGSCGVTDLYFTPGGEEITSYTWSSDALGTGGTVQAAPNGITYIFQDVFFTENIDITFTTFNGTCVGRTRTTDLFSLYDCDCTHLVEANPDYFVEGIDQSCSIFTNDEAIVLLPEIGHINSTTPQLLSGVWYYTNDPTNILSSQPHLFFEPSIPSRFVSYDLYYCGQLLETYNYEIILEANCVDDGDCSNGTEMWDESACSCIQNIVQSELGCTDPAAPNYDPNAICDDGSCCQYVLNLNGTIPTNAYQAQHHIISNGQVINQSNGPVSFDAGNYIDLLPGFEADATFQFDAYILGCQ